MAYSHPSFVIPVRGNSIQGDDAMNPPDEHPPTPVEHPDLDKALDEIDADRLADLFQQHGQTLSPPFYNCFDNTFANSPNFMKRLARSQLSRTVQK
jgi:hypothetical protein